jgi:hypothetical protein
MKVNTDSAMKPNRSNPGIAFGLSPDFPLSQRRWTTHWRVASLRKGGLLASQEIVRA